MPKILCPIEKSDNSFYASSSSACYMFFCEPTNCQLFGFDESSYICEVYPSVNITTHCNSSAVKHYLIVDFTYDVKFGVAATSELLLPTQIQIQYVEQCAVLCDALPNCTAFSVNITTYMCSPLRNGFQSIDSPNSIIFEPSNNHGLLPVKPNETFSTDALLSVQEHRLRESSCWQLCLITAECKGVVYKEMKTSAVYFLTPQLSRAIFQTYIVEVWVGLKNRKVLI